MEPGMAESRLSATRIIDAHNDDRAISGLPGGTQNLALAMRHRTWITPRDCGNTRAEFLVARMQR